MLKILIVDDSEEKVKKLGEVLKPLEEISIYNVSNLAEAYALLKEKVYDIIILDIQIPKRKGEKPLKNGGIKFLEQFEFGLLNNTLAIIGLTAYDTAMESYQKNFQDKLFTIIKYDITNNDWENKIKQKVADINLYKRQKQISYDYDLCIVCALFSLELGAIKNVLGEYKEETVVGDSTKYFSWKLSNNGKEIKIVAAAAPEMGMAASAVIATKMLSHFKPRYLAMTGIAAGIKDRDLNFGDIIVADPSWDYGFGKIKMEESGEQTFLSEVCQIRIDTKIKGWFEEIATKQGLFDNIYNEYSGNKPKDRPKLYLGPLASGAAVVANIDVVKNIIKQNRKLLGIEMETYGIYCAGQNSCEPKPKFFSLKSVSDYADVNKGDDYQSYAAFTSARVLKYIVDKYIGV